MDLQNREFAFGAPLGKRRVRQGEYCEEAQEMDGLNP